MAEEISKTEEKEEASPKKEKKPSSFNSKILLFGLPIFIVQVVIIYFVTANVLMSKIEEHETGKLPANEEKANIEKVKNSESSNLGKYIFSIEDVIVNPEGTDGKRLLLVSVGFDLAKEEDKNELKNKEVMVKDAIISTLSSKTLAQLSNVSYKDSIKTEINNKVSKLIPDIKFNAVYLSKYIIQ